MELSNSKGKKAKKVANKKTVQRKKAMKKKVTQEEEFSLTPQVQPFDNEVEIEGADSSKKKGVENSASFKQKKKVKKKIASPRVEVESELVQNETRIETSRSDSPQPSGGGKLEINLSRSLFRKIEQQAQDEGITLAEYVSELVAEGVVLRAWEIVERKGQMRSPQSIPSGNSKNVPNGNSQKSGNNANRNQRKGHRGMSHGRYQSIMDDKATFLEYVRNQEKNRR